MAHCVRFGHCIAYAGSLRDWRPSPRFRVRTQGLQFSLSLTIAAFVIGMAVGTALALVQHLEVPVLSQVVRTVSPIILSQTIILFQDTSLVYVLSLTDLLGAASKTAQINGRLVEMYLAVAVLYFVISFAASQLIATMKRRTAR